MGVPLASRNFPPVQLATQAVPLSQGRVPAGLRTALRGAIWAMINAFQFSLKLRRDVAIWTDNQSVRDRVRQGLLGAPSKGSIMMKDHDLWSQLSCRLGLEVCVINVRSHEDERAYSDVIEQWVIQCNEQVDAWLRLPSHSGFARSCTKTLQNSCTCVCLKRKHATKITQRFLVQIGMQLKTKRLCALRMKRNGTDNYMPPDQSHPTNFLLCLGPRSRICRQKIRFLRLPHLYMTGFASAPDAQPRWLTAAHALILFQSRYDWSPIGVRFGPRTSKWSTVDAYVQQEGFSFPQVASWFLACLRCLARYLGATYIHKPARDAWWWNFALLEWLCAAHGRKPAISAGRVPPSWSDCGRKAVRKDWRSFGSCVDALQA